MISVGIDVSKGKSTVCILKPYGEIVCSPFEIQHVEKDLEDFDSLLKKLTGDIRVLPDWNIISAPKWMALPTRSVLMKKDFM